MSNRDNGSAWLGGRPTQARQRAALEAVRKAASDPTLAVGDIVLYRGAYATVQSITRHAPGTHEASPIRNDWTAVQVVTDSGTRWTGVEPELTEWERDLLATPMDVPVRDVTADENASMEPQSGMSMCPCCGDDTMVSGLTKPELCSLCEEADCALDDTECQRDDTYESEDDPEYLRTRPCGCGSAGIHGVDHED